MESDFLARYLGEAAGAAAASAGPPLIIATIVGFVIALFQAVTQIQDQTLPLTAKIIAVSAAFLLFGASLTQPLVQMTDNAFRVFPLLTR